MNYRSKMDSYPFFTEPYDIQSPLDTPKIVEMVNNWESPFDTSSSLFATSTTTAASADQSTMVATNSYSTVSFPFSHDQQVLSPKLESSAINLDYLNSPEMAPVSPNKVCPPAEYTCQYDYSSPVSQQAPLQEVPYKTEPVEAIFYQPGTYLPASPITTTSYHHHQQQPHLQQLSMPQSPASISSNYSVDTPKTFTCLDSVPLSLPVDTYTDPLEHLYQTQDTTTLVPTMVDDMSNYSSTSSSSPSPPNVVIKSEPILTAYDSLFASAAAPATTTPYIRPTGQMPVATTSTSTLKPLSNKRPFNSATRQTVARVPSAGGITKKTRLTKREKQKQMDDTIERFTQENRDLSMQIDLLEKQIRFCRNYLSKHVAPVIQKQQQDQYMLTTSVPMLAMVEAN